MRSPTRSKNRYVSMKESTKKDVRRAIEFAANRALQEANDRNESESKGSKDVPSCDMSSGSHSSYLSRERATHRGSKRGLFEKLEIVHNGGSSYDGSFEREPTTTTKSNSRSGNKSKSAFTLFKKKKKNKKPKLTSEISKEAWICGVCARSFSSFEAAERHENYHIQEVVTDLGWSALNDTRDGLVNSRTPFYAAPLSLPVAEAGEPATTPQRIEPVSPSLGQPRPDILRMSTPSFTPALQRNRPRMGRRFSDDGQSYDGLGGDYDLTTAAGRNVPMSPIIEQRRDIPTDEDLMVPHGIKDFVLLTDEALVDVCNKAETMILTSTETEAEMELELLAKDKSYYDNLSKRAAERDSGGTYSKFRADGKSFVSKVQNKFVDAYQLMKEGKTKRGTTSMDHYNRKLKGDAQASHVIRHTQKTLYVNVIVKNSLKVVSHELERLAKERWKDDQSHITEAKDEQAERFQKFRAVAQGNLVKLAGLALASDFTPRRIAIQLSNDLYRLLTPRLKKRGVVIETEIEYRVGPYFVLAVNIRSVDWRRLVKMTHRDVEIRNLKWREAHDEEPEIESKPSGVIVNFLKLGIRLTKMTKFEILAQTLSWFYYLHWIIYTPVCWILYHSILAKTFREYFLSSVTDEIFYYVEEKGMEMDIGIRDAPTQAAFMLSALREIRADGQELKKKQKEGESDAKGAILGPLLGAAIKEDKEPAPPKPDGFEIPENLEYVGLELDLPVGFRRLRQAFLASSSKFIEDAVFREAAKYDNIEIGPWNKHDNAIGLPKPPADVKEEDFVGAEKEFKYLMPRSAFVKANMCYETAYVDAYNDYCFCLKKKALTPEVPYGSTFVAWTKFVVINTGSDSCRLVCSVEAEFPNGPPLVGRQIKSGMRAGVGELFVKIGETISKYADEFP